jgi:hypothetical protein
MNKTQKTKKPIEKVSSEAVEEILNKYRMKGFCEGREIMVSQILQMIEEFGEVLTCGGQEVVFPIKEMNEFKELKEKINKMQENGE